MKERRYSNFVATSVNKIQNGAWDSEPCFEPKQKRMKLTRKRRYYKFPKYDKTGFNMLYLLTIFLKSFMR